MIIDITQMKKRPKHLVSMGWAGTLGRKLSGNHPVHRVRLPAGEQKEAIIAQALNTDEGREALKLAIVEPVRRALEYNSVARKLLMVDELPQGALAHYERDITAFSQALTRPLTNKQKEALIAKALKNPVQRKALVDAMVEPTRCGGLEYD
jgi:hypothetical protein